MDKNSENMEKYLENLDNMEKFFKYDIEVKNILHSTYPKEEYRYSKETLIEYSDSLFKALNDIEYYIGAILDKFDFLEPDKKYFKNLISAYKDELIKSGYDFNKLKHFHDVCFANMREDLVNKVGENCFGEGGWGVSLNEAKSLNEVLHVVHQTIVNNQNNYRNLPVLASKKNNEGNNITLYGTPNEISDKIFLSFPEALNTDYVEIMSLKDDKVIMMVRDVGHALSIEIEKENDKYYVKYYIPKICNIDMVNNLKGVNKVTKESRYTVGMFETTPDKLPLEIADFVLKVPTDNDMYIKGGSLYREEGIQK